MIIRCESCSTLYDLDEALLAPGGSSVQCAKCQAVFTASPPRPGAAPPGQTPPPPAPAVALPAAVAPSAAPPGVSRPSDSQPRPARAGPNIYRRPQPPAASAPVPRGQGRAGGPARDAVSAMDARLRNLARWKLAAVPLGAVVLLLVVYGAWSVWKRRPDLETQRQRAEAVALIDQDDASSLARAVELLDSIEQGDHASSGAAGERGLARALLATAHADEAEPLVERLAAASAEKARLEREQPPGFEDGQRALAMEVARIEVELSPMRQRLEAVRSRASEELKALAAKPRGKGDAARGQAVLAVLDSNEEEVQRTAALLRAAGPDEWADLVELWLAVRRDGAARDQAIPRLVAFTGARPELIRARFVLARALLSAGRREEAISSLGRLLAANPRHERAQRLRAQLAVPRAVQPSPPPPPPLPRPRQAWVPPAAPQPLPAGATATPPAPAPPPANQAVVPTTEPPPRAPSGDAPIPAAPLLPPSPPPPRPKPPERTGAPDPTEG